MGTENQRPRAACNFRASCLSNFMMPHRILAILCALPVLAIAAPPATQPSMDRRCADLLSSWKDRFAEERLVAVVAPPFVIAGDGGSERVEGYRDATILAAMRALRTTYFE